MMVPRSQLLHTTAWVGLPLLLLGSQFPALALATAIALGVIGLAVLADAWISRRRLGDLQISMPESVALVESRETPVEGRITPFGGSLPPRTARARLRIGLLLPPQIDSPQKDAWVNLPAGETSVRVIWILKGLRRGIFRIESVRLERASWLGFWSVRASRWTPVEVRVYPNFLDERRRVARLFLPRPSTGLNVLRQVGKGREFEKLREYLAGDSLDEIDWKATARRGHPITKVFQVERRQRIYVLLDCSRLSARSGAFEKLVVATQILGLAADRQGDLFGLIVFSDRVHDFLAAGCGKAHVQACRDTLLKVEPRPVSPDFEEMTTFVRLRLKRRSLLILLTDLSDPVLAQHLFKSLKLLRRRHLVLVNMLRLGHAHPLFQEPELETSEELYRSLAGHLIWHELRQLERTLHREGIPFRLMDPSNLTASLVDQYLDIKQRQLL